MNIGNQAAFPNDPCGQYGPSPGMTYRQWLIGMTLQGSIASDTGQALSVEKLARWSIEAADAVIAKLEAEVA